MRVEASDSATAYNHLSESEQTKIIAFLENLTIYKTVEE